jgi:hypothetical protein
MTPKIISKGKPASQIKSVRKGSKKSLILPASLKGASIEDLMKVTGWARSAASSAIATDIVPLGYKVTLNEGVYTVVLPKGMKRPALR